MVVHMLSSDEIGMQKEAKKSSTSLSRHAHLIPIHTRFGKIASHDSTAVLRMTDLLHGHMELSDVLHLIFLLHSILSCRTDELFFMHC